MAITSCKEGRRANQEQLDILKQGVEAWRVTRLEIQPEVEAWNAWRVIHPDIRPDLGLANLSGADLRNADLSGADLHNANLSRTNLSGADLHNADLSRANLRDAFLRYVNLSNANLTDAYLSRANLQDANLSRATLSHTSLSDADLSRANLSGATMFNPDLQRVDLHNANLSGADLHNAVLHGAVLHGATLSYADLGGAYLMDTSFGGVDLSSVKGLEAVIHYGPSSIGIDTIYLSHGNIPEAFLKGAGVDDTFITYIRSLVGKPIEYYSCFISYSSKDDAFAKRLYADLQSNNVRCWFAPEDMKIGDKIRSPIDVSIRMYDRLLLILSEHSVSSKWVEFEVEAAIDKEQEGKPPVLVPVRLDSTVMESTTAWAAHIKRTRNIGDFTRWKNHDDYEKAFTRLLRDLKAKVTTI